MDVKLTVDDAQGNMFLALGIFVTAHTGFAFHEHVGTYNKIYQYTKASIDKKDNTLTLWAIPRDGIWQGRPA